MMLNRIHICPKCGTNYAIYAGCANEKTNQQEQGTCNNFIDLKINGTLICPNCHTPIEIDMESYDELSGYRRKLKDRGFQIKDFEVSGERCCLHIDSSDLLGKDSAIFYYIANALSVEMSKSFPKDIIDIDYYGDSTTTVAISNKYLKEFDSKSLYLDSINRFFLRFIDNILKMIDVINENIKFKPDDTYEPFKNKNSEEN